MTAVDKGSAATLHVAPRSKLCIQAHRAAYTSESLQNLSISTFSGALPAKCFQLHQAREGDGQTHPGRKSPTVACTSWPCKVPRLWNARLRRAGVRSSQSGHEGL